MARPKKIKDESETNLPDIILEHAVAKNNNNAEVFTGDVALANIKEWRELQKGKEYMFVTSSMTPQTHLLIIAGKCYYVARNNPRKIIELGGTIFPAIDFVREQEIIAALKK